LDDLKALQINLGMMLSKSTYSGQSQPIVQLSLGMSMEEFQRSTAPYSWERLQFALHPDTKVLVGWSKPNNQYAERSSTLSGVIPEKMSLFA